MDSDHSSAEAFEFFERFAFRGFDHESACDGEGHGGGVEAEIDKSFNDIIDTDVSFFVHGSSIDDAFMRNESLVAGIEDWVMLFEAFGDIVCVEDCDLRGEFQSVGAHHADVHPRDWQDACAAEGCCRDLRALSRRVESVFREEGSEVAFDCNGADTWSATAVRDTESFVEVKVRDVATELTGFGDTDECVEVSTVDVDLSTDAMDFLADGADTFLEDPVS